MVRTKFTKIKSIPKVSTGKSSPQTTNFADGIATYQPNDTMKTSQLRLAENARFDRIGEYKTRVGYKSLMTSPVSSIISKIGGSDTEDVPMGEVVPTSFTIPDDRVLYSVKIYISKSATAQYSQPYIDVSKQSSGESVARAYFDPDTIGTTIGLHEVVFMSAPVLPAGTYVAKVGAARASDYSVRVVTGSNTMKMEVTHSQPGKITNIFEANINGTKTVLFTFQESTNNTTTLYRMGASGGYTQIRALPSGVTNVRFNQNLNQIRYADGKEGPRLLNPASSWSDSAITTVDLETGTDLNIKVRDIMYGTSDNLIYLDADTDTQAVWCWPYIYDYNGGPINSYDKFNQDFRQNFPTIQTGDPVTAMFILGGVYYFMTRRNKYQMYAQTADQWSQSQCTAQNGTFSQESIICDLNYAYFANDTGIYRFNGMDEESITQNSIQNVYDAIPNKESIVCDLFGNRLYVFYSSTATGPNDHCLVYNINLEKWESFDSNTYVSATSARQNASGRFLCGHSKMGIIMQTEDKSINYADLNEPIAFNLETAYEHFGTTSQLKRIPKWRPEFATTNKPYTVACGYALDYTDDVQYAFSVDLTDNNTVSESYVWDEPSNYGVPTMPTILSTIPQINGEFYRVQLRYQHIAAFEPVTFRSHTVTVQTQRIR